MFNWALGEKRIIFCCKICKYLVCYAVRFLKPKKRNQFDDSDIEEILRSNIYNLLHHDKDFLKLILDPQKCEKLCLRVIEILSKHGNFLRVFELREKFYYLSTKKFEKQTMIRELPSCITKASTALILSA